MCITASLPLCAGRGDAVILCAKFALVLLFSLLSRSVDKWVAQVVLFASAIAYLGNFLVYMPHVRFEVNAVKCGFAAAFLFATISMYRLYAPY